MASIFEGLSTKTLRTVKHDGENMTEVGVY